MRLTCTRDQLDKAIASMEKYRRYEPESWQAKMMLAILLRRVKRFDEALKYYSYVWMTMSECVSLTV